MKKIYLVLLLNFCFSSIIISGKVVDDKKQPIPYANVYIENSFDGISTNEKGEFVFETFESGVQNLIVSYVGYDDYRLSINLDQELIIDEVVLKEKLTSVNEVVITAGSFEASDENRVVILSPIDIVTTAGGRGDITGALQSLPGSQPQNEKEGLFVRGGDGSEAKTIIDGLLIQNPYGSSVPDIPQRSRFTPFEFEGTAFSTGGYSAQYGQALSSIVDLTTWNRFGDYNAHNLGVTPLSITYGRAVFNDSLGYGIRLDYSNLQPYQDFFNKSIFKDWFKSNYNFLRAPEGINITTDFKQKLSRGIFKYNGRFAINQSKLDLDEDNLLANDYLFSLENRNSYYSFNYRGKLGDSWAIQLGGSYSENIDYSDVSLPGDLFPLISPTDTTYIDTTLFIDEGSYDDLLQFRSVFIKNIFSNSKVKFGLHFFDRKNKFLQFQIDETAYGIDRYNEYNRELDEFLSAGFVEMDFSLSRNIAARLGVRVEHSKLINKNSVAPRLSMAYKVGNFDQVSYAYGKFYQTPEIGFDDWYERSQPTPNFNPENLDLEFEMATHQIFNYQWVKRKRIFRVELYDKKYENLIKKNIDLNAGDDYATLNNDGYGYAKGVDLFWRDNKYSFENIDYWVSYSYLDTKRNYRDFPGELRPSFAAEHVLSIIYKQDIKIKDNQFVLSMGYTATSGRPWFEVLDDGSINEEVSKPYQSFNIGGSVLPKVKEGNFLVVFFNIENPFGYQNSYGKRKNFFTGQYEDIKPKSLRTFFIGCFVSFSIGDSQDE